VPLFLLLVLGPSLVLSGRVWKTTRTAVFRHAQAQSPVASVGTQNTTALAGGDHPSKGTKVERTSTAKKVADVASSALAADHRVESGSLRVAVHTLLAGLRKKQEKEPYDQFLARCLEQAKAVVAENDKSYTDINLEANLLIECDLDREFPTVHEDGFKSHAECQNFAKKLHQARFQELRHNKTDGYKDFCAAYYIHTYPETPKVQKPVKKSNAALAATSSFSFFIGASSLLISAIC